MDKCKCSCDNEVVCKLLSLTFIQRTGRHCSLGYCMWPLVWTKEIPSMKQIQVKKQKLLLKRFVMDLSYDHC